MTQETEPAAPAATAATAAPAAPERPRIYVACLAAYSEADQQKVRGAFCPPNGCLHGRWIDVTTPEEIMAAVREMLAASPVPNAEEWAIHDYAFFEPVRLSEHESFEAVCAVAGFMEEHGALAAKLYAHFGEDLEEAKAAFENYAGEFKCAAAFAEDLIRETGPDIPKALEYYIDWASLARDMEINGEILVFETGFDEVHIFWAR